MPFLLSVETDYDFALRFNGQDFADYEFTLLLDSVEQLDEIEILGAWGTEFTPDTKCQEFQAGIAQIKANPNEFFSNTGGNRGVEWFPFERKLNSTHMTVDDGLNLIQEKIDADPIVKLLRECIDNPAAPQLLEEKTANIKTSVLDDLGRKYGKAFELRVAAHLN